MKKRRLIQVICAVLYNCNFTGFAQGTIYKGDIKNICVPGLNCYSCPGAVGSCPLGSLQTALLSSKYRFPYYMLGLILLFGVLFGRLICSFLCPFGLLQELLYKIPGRKIGKSRWTRVLSYVKYIILILFVIALPLAAGIPAFCKYICPAGTLEGGLPLVLINNAVRDMAGWLLNYKVIILIAILVIVIFCHRAFCRFICPLGALYGLFNKISIFGIKLDEKKCTHCNACIHHCHMDVKKVGDRECIQCGECIKDCKAEALSMGVKLLHKQNISDTNNR